jgi:C4-type Zn-finger protein
MNTNQSPPECPSCGQQLRFARLISNFRTHVVKPTFECKNCGIFVPKVVASEPTEPQPA